MSFFTCGYGDSTVEISTHLTDATLQFKYYNIKQKNTSNLNSIQYLDDDFISPSVYKSTN